LHKRTKALSIPIAVKEAVAERDSFDGWPCCLMCGSPAPVGNRLAYSCCHYISRSQGGVGCEENILTLCPACHREYDQTTERSSLKSFFRRYLKSHYPEWDEQKLYYTKE
jgi:5-methylcytosine-specific restriction endonuclease McrA